MLMEDSILVSGQAWKIVRQIARGHSATVFFVQNEVGNPAALKVAREDSGRRFWLQKERDCLKEANGVGVGPKLLGWDENEQAILMEFVDGSTLVDWLEECISSAQWNSFENALLEQSKRLDDAAIDHGQLSKLGKNILVRDGLPVIIDFEKASLVRKPHNEGAVRNLFFENKRSWIVQRVQEIKLQ